MKYKKKKAVLCSLLCSMFFTSYAYGEVAKSNESELEQVFNLDECVVTATRLMNNKKNVPASVDIITAEEIKEKNIMSITEALQTKTGVYLSPVAQGGIMIRGFNSADILVLLDGQPMNSGWNGIMNWEMIPVENVAKIEIVRGAGSSLYGGRAVGAIVNITTKDNQKETSFDGVVSYGSNSTWKKSIYIDQNIDEKFSVGGGYENRSSDGFRGFYRSMSGKKVGSTVPDYQANLPKLADGTYLIGGRGEKTWENENYSFNMKYKFDADKSLKYTYTKMNNDYSYKNPFSYVVNKNGNQVFAGTVLTQDGKVVTLNPSKYLGYVGKRETDLHTFNYLDSDNKVQINLGLVDTKKDGFSSAASPKSIDWDGKGTNSFYPSKSYNLDFQKSWNEIDNHTIVAGFNWKTERFDQTRYNLEHWKDHNSIINFYEKNGGKAKNIALFVQDELKLSELWQMNMGLRYDHYKKYGGYSNVYGQGIFDKDKSAVHGEGSYSQLSPKIALEYSANEFTNYYASYGHSFNPPILYQVFRHGDEVWANPDLKPETSDAFEIGMKKILDEKTNLDLSLYHVKTKDKVAYMKHYKPGTTIIDHKIYENAGTEKRKGIELDLTHQFNDKLEGYINYALQDGKITDAQGETGKNYDIPKHLLHAGIGYTQNKCKFILDGQYVSERQAPDLNTGEYGAEDAFFVVNTYVNYQINPETTLQFGIQNVLDREFFASEATSGRTYNISLRYQF